MRILVGLFFIVLGIIAVIDADINADHHRDIQTIAELAKYNRQMMGFIVGSMLALTGVLVINTQDE